MATKRTTINIDPELVARAQAELGTSNMTETITKALEAAVYAAAARRLAQWDLGGLDLADLERSRRPREFTFDTNSKRDAS